MSRVVAGSWYAEPLAQRLPTVVTEDALLAPLPAPLRAALGRSAALRAAALVAVTGRRDTLVTTNPSPGTRTLVTISGLLGRRNLVLLEYIAHPPAAGGVGGAVRRLAFTVLRRTLLPRAVRAAQVLTEAERAQCASSHHAPAELFHYVPWPSRTSDSSTLPARENTGRRVLASGRRTDWETFFAAARGRSWEVTAVCASEDADSVATLAAGTGSTVLVEIPADEHEAQVRSASVYVVPVPETGASIGQIRIMNAADAGTPLVISAVQGIEAYTDQGSAVLVPPGDPVALGAAVDALLSDPERQEQLRRALFDRGSHRTMADYLDDVARLVQGQPLSTRERRVPPSRHPSC